MQAVLLGISDIWTLTKRNLMRFKRTPQVVVFSSIQPIMFLTLFNYVFGGAIGVATSGPYINFLLPGIIAQSAIFGTLQTPIALIEDLDRGSIDRFRSLPIIRSAVLAARTSSDNMRTIFVLLLLFGVGILMGFDATAPASHVVAALALMAFFSYAFSWMMGALGLFIRNAEAMQTAGFLFVFPLTFASSVFVPVQSMPEWLQVFARNQPVTQIVNATRSLMFGGDLTSVWITLVWAVGILAVSVPLAIWKFRRTV
jgi:ABC-2 type transport system permease protein/oleandomycin transport system permease protein